MLVPSSLLSRSTASFSDRGSLNGYVLVSGIFYPILAMTSLGSNASTPNREGAIPKSRMLNVTKASARPLMATSKTISSLRRGAVDAIGSTV